MRTPDEIKAAIERLKQNKLNSRTHNMFGDNNHDAIDAAIETLEDNLDEDELYEKLDNEEWTQHTFDFAYSILNDWKEGDGDLEDCLYPEN